MKYLIMEDFSGKPIAFIFPDLVDHADMREQLPYTKALSGGYLELEQGLIHCFGGYAELELKSSPDDVKIITNALRKK